ncbi:MAG: MarR family transcriptional regulator [Planctomycetota bacterium]|nr:MarR family transcriptional regulator [Planctomycetota bacterium]
MSQESLATIRKFDSQEQEVYLSLWRTYDRLKAIEDDLFGQWGITSQQYNVLRILQAAAPEPVPTLQISNRLISRAPDITRMLDKLQLNGWIRRVRTEEDRRTVLVEITDEGQQLLEKLEEPVKSLHISQLGHLSQTDRATLCQLLQKTRKPHEPPGGQW